MLALNSTQEKIKKLNFWVRLLKKFNLRLLTEKTEKRQNLLPQTIQKKRAF